MKRNTHVTRKHVISVKIFLRERDNTRMRLQRYPPTARYNIVSRARIVHAYRGVIKYKRDTAPNGAADKSALIKREKTSANNAH